VIGHCASIMRNDDALFLCGPCYEIRIGHIAEAGLIRRYDIQVRNAK
jgi:hypothetical protein